MPLKRLRSGALHENDQSSNEPSATNHNRRKKRRKRGISTGPIDGKGNRFKDNAQGGHTMAFLGMNEHQLALKSKVWHSTASICAVPQLTLQGVQTKNKIKNITATQDGRQIEVEKQLSFGLSLTNSKLDTQ